MDDGEQVAAGDAEELAGGEEGANEAPATGADGAGAGVPGEASGLAGDEEPAPAGRPSAAGGKVSWAARDACAAPLGCSGRAGPSKADRPPAISPTIASPPARTRNRRRQ